MDERTPEETTTNKLPLVDRVMILLGRLRDTVEKGSSERLELRGRLIELLAEATEAELYQIAVEHIRAREESWDMGLDTALEKLRALREEGQRLAEQGDSGKEP